MLTSTGRTTPLGAQHPSRLRLVPPGPPGRSILSARGESNGDAPEIGLRRDMLEPVKKPK